MKTRCVFLGTVPVLAILLVGALSAAPIPVTNSVGLLGNAEVPVKGVPPGPITVINITKEAQSNFSGDFASATVLWSGSACSNAFKLKFFRRNDNNNVLHYLDERGPFNTQPGFVTVSLNPPVTLQGGDIIGIEIDTTTCGLPALTADASGYHAVFYQSDVTGDVTLTNANLVDRSIAVQAVAGQAGSADSQVLSATVLGVGSVTGAAGANFKTALQLSNPGSHPIAGTLVFHPIGHSASPTDPSLPYSLAPFQTTSFSDIIAAMNASGLGSLDIFTNASYPPVVLTRVFSDGGAAGTFGYTEPTVHPDDPFVLKSHGDGNDSAWLVAPDDLTRFRYNIGVRTLYQTAQLTIQVYDTNGTLLTTVNRSYDQNVFALTTAQAFLNGFAVAANQSIKITATQGEVLVCGIPVENTSNDTSFQLGDRRRY